ncbi:MAG TPA: DUF2975 domain-containing protein [Microthrixaceae bacterium]|nr:DUF2975 domain-containing protein [Microthrixaceae bacterium]
MRRWPSILLQIVMALIGTGALAILLWEPHIEGRNANATLSEIYFRDPFLAFVYLGSIPFFVALYQSFRAFGWARSTNEDHSGRAIRAMRLIRVCTRITIGFVVAGVAILMVVGEERPPAVFMGAIATTFFLGLDAFAAAFERRTQPASI